MERVKFFKFSTTNVGSDDLELYKFLANANGYKVVEYIPEEFNINIDREKEWLLNVGLTEALNYGTVHEFFGGPNKSKIDILSNLMNFLDKVITSKKLFILDRYLFPKKYDTDYETILTELIKRYLPKLEELTFVVSKDYNDILFTEIKNELIKLKPELQITIKHSEAFHDRFWISDFTNKGAFLGTSLNGLGKKYCIIDYINEDDVKELNAAMIQENLI